MVLAGGASKRMGRDKRTMRAASGLTFPEQAAATLRRAGAEQVLVSCAGHSPSSPRPFLPDLWPKSGPLAGMATALWKLDRFDAVAFLPCDMPLLTPEWPRRMLGLFESARLRPLLTLQPEGRLQPLVSVVGRGHRESLASAVERGHLAAGRLLLDLDAVAVRGLPPRRCLNVNTPGGRKCRRLRA